MLSLCWVTVGETEAVSAAAGCSQRTGEDTLIREEPRCATQRSIKWLAKWGGAGSASVATGRDGSEGQSSWGDSMGGRGAGG